MLSKKLDFLFRKKTLVIDRKIEYKRTLGLLDITAIGLSCSLNGIFVMIGEAVKLETGPSIAISFIIAAIACILSGYCFCELAAKIQSSGAAYSYLYVSMGEFLAFCMGWNYILQYIIAVSSDARALSQNIDSLAFNMISNYSLHYARMDIPGLSSYPDFLSFFIIITTSMILMFGIKESSKFNKTINFGVLSIILIIIIFGFNRADIQNWSIEFFKVNETVHNVTHYGSGGFTPYGVKGIFECVSKCFYAFIGFDAIASTSEESKNPKRDIPNAIVLTITILSFCYIILSCVLTLMRPYYLVDELTPFSSAFESVYPEAVFKNINIFKLLIIINVLMSIFVSIYGEIYVVSRIICTMALDGLLFKCLSKLSRRFQTPYFATILTALLAGVFALLIDIMELIDILSIGALSAYCVVSICVVLLRFNPEDVNLSCSLSLEDDSIASNEVSCKSFVTEMFSPSTVTPSLITKKVVNVFIATSILTMISICVTLRILTFYFNYYLISLLSILVVLLLIQSVIIQRQPQQTNKSSFQVPYVPFFPFVSFIINMYLMLTVSLGAWLIFVVWMFLGLLIYFSYGLRQSKECPKRRQKLTSTGSCSTRMVLLSESSSTGPCL